jgi:hypothetical protein
VWSETGVTIMGWFLSFYFVGLGFWIAYCFSLPKGFPIWAILLGTTWYLITVSIVLGIVYLAGLIRRLKDDKAA